MLCWIKQEQAEVDDDHNLSYERDEIGPSLKNVKKEFICHLNSVKKEPIDILIKEESNFKSSLTEERRQENNFNRESAVKIKEEFVPNSSDNPRASNSKPDDIDIKEHFPLDNNRTGFNYVEVPVEFDETKNNLLQLSENTQIPVDDISDARTKELKVKEQCSSSFLNDSKFDLKKELNVQFCNDNARECNQCEFCDLSTAVKGNLDKHTCIHTKENPYKCVHCNYKATTKVYLNHHMKVKHSMKKTFSCNLCSKQYFTRRGLNSHVCINTGPKRYKCNYCVYSSAQKKCLVEHIRIHTGEKPYKCDNCDYSTARRSDLTRHSRLHTGEKPYKCKLCNFSTADKGNLNNHLEVKHKEEKVFSCHICLKQYFTRRGLNSHICINTGPRRYKCNYCGYSSAQKKCLVEHIRIHTGEKPYICEHCDYCTARRSDLTRHSRLHTGEKRYECDLCNFSTAHKAKLINHLKNKHTKEKSFPCNICSKQFGTNRGLKSHDCLNKGTKRYKCRYCSYSTVKRKSLIEHIRIHTGEKPYKCEHCDYSSARQGDLVRHFRLHTGEKPYQCEVCNFSTADKVRLTNHVKTRHIKEKSFSCNICLKLFGTRKGFNSHVRKHTNVKPYKCEYCDYRAAEKYYLSKHIKIKHTIELTASLV